MKCRYLTRAGVRIAGSTVQSNPLYGHPNNNNNNNNNNDNNNNN